MPAPADQLDYPTIADLKVWLTDAKFILPSDVTLTNKLSQAIAVFESQIGRRVLSVVQTYKLPCRGQDRVALPRSCSSVDSVTVLGTLYVAGNDYDAMSPDGNPPYEWIEFTAPLPMGFQVSVSGSQWGRVGLVVAVHEGLGATVPYLAWTGMLSLACIAVVPEVAAAVSLGRARYEAGESVEYFSIRGDGGPYEFEMGQWVTAANQAIAAFRRVAVGAGGR